MSYSSQVQTSFSGPSDTSTYPPDSGLAIGPNYVVMIDGSQIEWTNLTGGSPTVQSVYSFFSPLSPTGGLYDQHVIYDSVNQRFVTIMQYLAPDGTTTDIDVAVSKDSNPNDGWTFSQLNTTVTIGGQATDSDRPMLAVDGSNVYISAAQYNINVSGYAGTENWVISDTAGLGGGIYGGGTLSVTASEVTPSTQGIFAVAAGNNGKTYYASDSSSGGQIVISLQTYDKTTNTFSATSTVALGNIDQGGSYTAQQQGTNLLLDAGGDNRIANMVYANGFLYGVAEMKPVGSSVPLVHWFKIDVSNPSAPSLVAQGDVSGTAIGTSVATFNPSIAVDAAGDVLINFTASGPNMYPADYYVFQGGSDPVGSFSAPVLYQASTGFFNSGDGSSVQSWGLNSSATVDPNNPNSFWISNEYVSSGWWQTAVARVAIQSSTSGATVSSIASSGTGITSGAGDLNAGKVVTLTVNFSAAVTVNTSGGTPSLTFNDGGTASYTGGSGGTALTFSYTVAAGQNTADLIVSALNLNGATITGGGNAANLTGATNYNPAGTLQIDTTAPTIASIVATGTGITNGTGNVSTGGVVTLTVNLSEAVTVNTTGGTPTLTLNDGGTASYTSGSGGTALTFSYTVAAGQATSDLAISALNLNGAVINDGAGNATNLSGATNYNPTGALQVNSTATTVASIAASGTGITSGAGDLNAGKVVTLTVNFSAAVTVNTTGGAPTLTLNDGGTASYTGGSGGTALTFSYTVAAGQNTADLIISALNLNGAAITDGSGNAANLSAATNYNPAGTLQIDTTAPTIASIAASGTGITSGSGDLNAGKLATLTVNFSEAVTVNTTGGTPTLTLSDGGTASYTGGSGGTALTFSYTVAAGQNSADLIVSALNLNGATITDSGGNAANPSGATNYNPAGTLQIDTTVPTIATIVATGTGITNGSGSVSTGQVVTLTVNLSEAVTVNTAGGAPTLTLNDGGTANYTGGSGGTALTFSYTVAAGQTTSDLAVSALNLNGAVISDGAGNGANLAGATNYNPAGTLQVNVVTTPTSSIQTLFSGPSTTSNYPPHNGLAVGSNFVVMIEGSLIEWTNLAGGSPTQQSVYSFFSSLSPTGGLFDQRVVYDSVNQRFVAMMEYLAPDGTTTAMDIAVSKDSNPNDGWTFSRLNTTVTINGQLTDSDRPMLAVDGSNVYISAAQYNINVSGYAGTENWVIGDTAGAGGGIYGGGTLSVTASEAMPSTQRIFAVAAGNNGKTYYASDFSSGGQIVVALQTYDKATKTFSSTSTIALGNIDQGGSYTVQQKGTSLLLDAVDNRIASMVYANGYLYAVAEMKPSGSSVPLVHWFKIDVSNPSAPSLVTQGDISGASLGTGVGTFDPSIAVDASGDVIINFTASGPNLYPSDYYVFQSGSNPGGSFSAPILYQASTGFFNSGDGNSVQRWGLNSSAIVDPNNPNSFWISSEYVANGWWQTSVARIGIQNSATGPAISSIAASGTSIASGTGDLNAGKVVTLTVNFSAAVTVNASGGTPSLTLNDGGTANYTGGSGGTALTFSYTVAAGQNAADLIISSFNLNGAAITDGSGNAANLSAATNYNPAGTLQIDTTAPTIASIVATGTGITNGSGNVSTGQVVTLTVNLSEAVTVNTTGGTPTLTLNDGGTASYTSGSGSTALTFSYTVAAGQTTSDLAISSFNLNGAVVSDGAGNAANLAGAANYNPAGTLQVNSTATTVASIAASGTGIASGTGDLNAGKVVTLTVNFSAAVTVNTSGGTPSLALNDGGTASYTGGSGGTALTFSYTVAAGQNAADLIISALNLNGATITGGNGNAVSLTGATNYNPAGTLQIDTTAPTIASIVATGTGITNGTGNVSTGQVVTLTVNLSEAVTVYATGGTPTLTLNDGGTANYTSGSGSTALTFSYTVAAGQTTSDLAISALNLNGAVINDGAGNATNLSGATNYNPAGTLQVNPTTTTTGVPKYSHIVVVVEENHNYDQIAGNSQAPYINSLMAGGASLTNMTAEAHPSQANYFALYGGSTFGVTDDNSYSLPDPTLYTVLKNGGYSFTGYVDEGGIGSDFNHDPWVSFPEGRTVQTNFTSFPALFANGNYSSLPTVSYVIPSVSNDMHDGTIAQGDTWLQQNLSAYAQWAVNNNSLLIVTWDENDDSTSEAASNQVPTLLYGANVVPGNYSTAYNHYNLLSTITASLGLTAPNNAATAAPIQVFGATVGAAALTTADQDGVAESPALTISSSSLTVQAGGSIALGITATPVDSDDQLSLSISGLPSYESITAPAGNTVTSSLQSNGTYTWTITEGSSTIGQPLTGLTLSSSYTGTDHPVATFTVTASNTTSGETATSASQTMAVTDPPAPSPTSPNVGLSQDPSNIDRLAALMNQFAAAGFGGNSCGPSLSTPNPNVGWDNPAVLAAAHSHTG